MAVEFNRILDRVDHRAEMFGRLRDGVKEVIKIAQELAKDGDPSAIELLAALGAATSKSANGAKVRASAADSAVPQELLDLVHSSRATSIGLKAAAVVAWKPGLRAPDITEILRMAGVVFRKKGASDAVRSGLFHYVKRGALNRSADSTYSFSTEERRTNYMAWLLKEETAKERSL